MPNDSAKKSPQDNLSHKQYQKFKKYWQLNLTELNSMAKHLPDKTPVTREMVLEATFKQIKDEDIELARAVYNDEFYQPYLKGCLSDAEIKELLPRQQRTKRCPGKTSKMTLQIINAQRLFQGKRTIDRRQYEEMPVSETRLIERGNRKSLLR